MESLTAVGAAEVTTSNTAEISPPYRALYVGVTGNVKVTTEGGDVATFVAVPAGTVLPVRCKLVWATGTTATSIVGLR